MSFYTAGTGGAGPTIVSATFLLLAEPPLNYREGQEVRAEPWGQRHLVDFGPPVGQQPVHLLDEPEASQYGSKSTTGGESLALSHGLQAHAMSLDRSTPATST